jgi:enoyl-CoA hydratase/carnithine racemase
VRVDRDGAVLTVTLDRPQRHNALTLAMYEAVAEACRRADDDPSVRVLVLRGGERAFSTGTDIAHFGGFTGGADGVDYERTITGVVDRLEDVDVPTVAAVSGHCLGGGLLLAAACDIRVGTASARLGVPVARTLGNCVSANSLSLLQQHIGAARALDVLLRGRVLTGEEAHAAGLLAELCADGELDAAVAGVVDDLLRGAPLTQWAAKELTRRLRRAALPPDDDVVGRVYGSDDFRAAVRAFADRSEVRWTGL